MSNEVQLPMSKAARKARVQVSLTGAALERLQCLADERGLAPATLAAAVLGEYLAGKSRDEQSVRRYSVVEK